VRLKAIMTIGAGLLLGGAPAAFAGPLATDRPDIAESSLALARGVYQLEQATQVEWSGAGVAKFPSLHRFGLGRGLELRLETPITAVGGGPAAFTGAALGGKLHLLDGGEWGSWPSVALLAHLDVDPTFQVEPIGKLLVDAGLPGDFDLGFNAGLSRPVAGGPTASFAGSLSHDLVGPFRSYLELSGDQGLAAGTGTLGVDGGVTLLLNDDLQLDTAVYRGLTPGAVDWYVTSGMSARFGSR
jgi:hypothetical protein